MSCHNKAFFKLLRRWRVEEKASKPSTSSSLSAETWRTSLGFQTGLQWKSIKAASLLAVTQEVTSITNQSHFLNSSRGGFPKKQKIVTVYDRELDDHIFQEPRSLWHFVSHDQSWIMIANFEKIWTTITHDHDWRSLLFTLKFLYHTTNPYTLPETSSSSPYPSMNLKNDRKWLLNFQTQSKNVSHECMLTIDHDCQFW